MIESLYIAATGMHAQQTQIDVTANNLANVNTPAFKKSQVLFEDLMVRQNAGLSVADAGGAAVGRGAHAAGSVTVFSDGAIKQTGRPLDLAIRGNGFFEVLLPDGSQAYTRNGVFHVNADGSMVTADGYPLTTPMRLPADAAQVVVQGDGTVLAQVPDEPAPVEVGRIELGTFANTSGLKSIGSNLYLPTNDSGDAIMQAGGENGAGQLVQGALEGSNVALIEELTNLLLAQRAYEVNSKVVQAADDVLGIINNLRR